MDGPPFFLAFVMVKERFVVPAIFFYLESAANKRKGGDHLNVLRQNRDSSTLILSPIFLFCATDSRTMQNKISEYLLNMTDRGAINNDDDDDDATIEWGWGDDEGR